MKSVLIVDDNVALSNILSKLIKKIGYDVICENLFKTGLDLMKTKPFHVVLLNLPMIGFETIDSLTILEQKNILVNQNIILFTGLEIPDSVIGDWQKKGLHSVIKKPVEFETITKELDTVLSKEKYGIFSQEPLTEAPSKEETPKVEEPLTEEPLTEEPLTEEPLTEEPLTEEPLTEEPLTEEPLTEEPLTEEPLTEEPLTEEPLTEEPLTEEPLTEEPLTEEPLTEEPLTEEPLTMDSTKKTLQEIQSTFKSLKSKLDSIEA